MAQFTHFKMNDVHYYLHGWDTRRWENAMFHTSGTNHPLFPGKYLLPHGNGSVTVYGKQTVDGPRAFVEQRT